MLMSRKSHGNCMLIKIFDRTQTLLNILVKKYLVFTFCEICLISFSVKFPLSLAFPYLKDIELQLCDCCLIMALN